MFKESEEVIKNKYDNQIKRIKGLHENQIKRFKEDCIQNHNI